MLISLGVLAQIFEHFGDSKKVKENAGPKAVNEVLAATRPITALRAYNSRLALGLDFASVEISEKFDMRKFEFKLGNYCLALARVSAAAPPSSELERAAAEENIDELGPRGKDALAVAGVALRHRYGSMRAEATSWQNLLRLLHSSCGLALSESNWLALLKGKLALT